MKKMKRVLVFLACLVCLASVALADDTSGSINIEGAVEVVMAVEQDVDVNVRLAWDSGAGTYQSVYDSDDFISKTDGHVLLEGPANTEVSISVPTTVNIGDAVLSLDCKFDPNSYNDAGVACATHNLSDSGNGYIALVPTQVQYSNTDNEIGTKTGSVTVTVNWD